MTTFVLDDDNVDMIELIRTASAIDDHMKHMNINDIITYIDSNKEYKIKCMKASQLSIQQKEMLFNLFEKNMKEMYEKTWGWNKDDKMKELFTSASKFLMIIAEKNENEEEIIAFSMFRFEWDDEDEPEYPVLYCYELQISNSYQGKGIGKHIMELLNKFQKATHMKKVMLTCFKINAAAMNFYLKNGFYIDECSPSRFGDVHCHYEILSNDKPKPKKKRSSELL